MIIFLIVLVAYLVIFIAHAQIQHSRRVAECREIGHHVWEPAGPGDHPNHRFICARCFKAV